MAVSVASMIDQFNMPNIRLLLEMGYEVHVACNFKEGNTCDASRILSLRKNLQELGVVMHQWDCPRKLYTVKSCYRAYQQLKELLMRYPVRWMHSQSPIGGVLSRLAAEQANIPVVYTAHGFHFYRGAPWKNWLLYYPVEKLLARRTDILITVNQEDDLFARRHLHAGKIVTIPGVGIDTAHFKELCKDKAIRQEEKQMFRKKYQIPADSFVLLSTGELNQGKNHRMVIDALAAMHRTDVCYLICGQGMLKDRLQQYADRRGVGGQLRMPGYQSDMAQIYRNADIFVFPSRREGMPVALMEAMAAGLPCVVSDIRGNRELIGPCGAEETGTGCRSRFAHECMKKNGGLRFSLNQPEQLQLALEILLEQEPLRQECAARNQKKIKAYDQAVVQKKMKKIYGMFSGRI